MSRLNIIFLITFVGLLIWITLFHPSSVGRIQRGAMVILRPFMKASNELDGAINTVGKESLSPVQLREKLSSVEQDRDRLKLEVIQLDELLAENNQLREALQYRKKSPLSLVATRVISRKPSHWYNTLVIDKGSAAGIVVDSPVIIPMGDEAGLVGKISEVIGPKSAVVLLLTDEMCQVSAKLENSHEQGILNGQRGALRALPNLKLRYLSKEAVAIPGQKVISSGTGELFPANLILGEVLSVSMGIIDAEAVVKPSVNFDDLVDVFVILPADRSSDQPAVEAPTRALSPSPPVTPAPPVP
ncbi:MAG: rod shape-determining protein MreC [Verrucomicrobiales bacterium]|nr:rod shape-determining protein MreC [Verrucomicrobiales bacterium]MDP4938793.1 rod shape-determining protein MreC [Verrucomicrobiales bacterium]